ncbi:MAG: GH1 family beta-glucosidase [Lentimonas sp.]
MSKLNFPKDFTWGVAAAAYQIEGAWNLDGKGPSIWDTFTASKNGQVRDHAHGQIACDHYHRYKEDIALMQQLGVDSYRLSLSWPRILPEGVGRVNSAGLDFYSRLCDELIAAGIRPFVTLYHWDLPQTLSDKGGWINRDIADWFAEYASVVAEALGDRVSDWITFNEPQISIGFGYLDGTYPPGYKGRFDEYLKAGHNQLLAHGEGVQAIRAHSPQTCRIGIAPNCDDCYLPASESPADIEAARTAMFQVTAYDQWQLAWWCDPIYLGNYPEDGLALYEASLPEILADDMATICQPLDFMGFNHYKSKRARAGANGLPEAVAPKHGAATGTLDWLLVEPETLYWGPRFAMERYGKLPYYVTENGYCNNDFIHRDGACHDPERIDFVARYLENYSRLHTEGFPIAGYYLWSVLDNFEWIFGYHGRFGLIHVDFETLKRTPKDSYHWYRRVIESHGTIL